MKKRLLLIDRDGTIIVEPPEDYQVDSLEKLAFLPSAISRLRQIAEEMDFVLVMVTNQDGLGTESFPEADFIAPHQKMMDILTGENIHFYKVHIDKTFEHENAPTRKPRTGMLTEYFAETYDLANSFVIGDRLSDIELAENLGAKGILIGDKTSERAIISAKNWDEIYYFLQNSARRVHLERKTSETQISIELDLDGEGIYKMDTGVGFFDHMLDQLARHSGINLTIQVKGDLHIDEHHTIEDTALALGEAFQKALGNKQGINRYGHFSLPMDDVLTNVALDFSGRPWLVWQADFQREKVGEMPTEMVEHFFKSFADSAACNLNIKAEGQNDHHKIEAIFKAFAKSMKMAIYQNLDDKRIPSTKGIL